MMLFCKIQMTTKTKTYLAALIPLSAVAFFNPFGVINDQLSKFLFLFSCCLVSVILLFNKNPKLRNYPKFGFFLLYCGIFTGYLITVLIHGQGAITALITLLPIIFAYSCFFIFYKLNIPKSKILNLIKILTILGIIVYIINRIFYPNIIFGTKEGGDRAGMLRMWIPFIELQILMLFYYIEKVAKNGLSKNMTLWLIVYGAMVILSVTRQLIILSFILGTLLYLYNTRGAKKFIVAIFICAICITVVPHLPIVEVITETTEQEAARTNGMENNVRVIAWEYFTEDAQESIITKIFGNGIPALQKTKWGRKIDRETNAELGGLGLYTADIGWAGIFFYFGFIGTIGLLLCLFSAIKESLKLHWHWITGWLLLITITSVSSGFILYYHQIVSITMIFYIVYGKNRSHYIGIQ